MKAIKKSKKKMIIITSILVVIFASVVIFMQGAQFGQNPKGKRLERIKQSENYSKGEFKNIEKTPTLTEGYGFFKVMYEFLFTKSKRTIPTFKLPSVKTEIHSINPNEDVLIWFGHSSYFMQIDSKKILVDPVFSGSPSPLPNNIKAFEGTERYSADDFDHIDYLFITHDHWDHLDYKTMIALKEKTDTIICPLGVGQHFERWGFNLENVFEKDWNEEITLNQNFKVNVVPSRHFSGRGFKRNKTLWASFILQTPNLKIFMGGDGGYGTHYSEIGKQHGPFDLALLENGQYDIKWKYIHMMPNEVVKAAGDLQAKRFIPIHSGKFKLANHAWDEPLKHVTEAENKDSIPVLTPMIGEKVLLNDTTQKFIKWWEGVE